MLELSEAECRNISSAGKREWLVTNGIGGYSSSTASGMNTRRYHGLLVAATKPPLGRVVLLSQLEDALVVAGTRYELSTHLYQGSVVHPTGHLNLKGLRLDPFPIFTYGGDGWRLEKSIFMVHGENTTVVQYKFSDTKGRDASLEVRPLVAFRDYHGTTHENDALDPQVSGSAGCVRVAPYPDLPALYLAHDAALVEASGYWYRNFEYMEERARGLDSVEDLFSPLLIRAELSHERSFSLVAYTEERSAEDVHEYRMAEVRRDSIAHLRNRETYGRSELVPLLHRAADQFIVTRSPYKTLLAGYHWFGDWGRDSMIALPGLLLATDRPDLALEILLQYVLHIDGGMLPNRFPDAGEKPEYNTVDATLWFFEAVRQYFAYRADAEWRQEALATVRDNLYEPLKQIVAAHLSGTRFGIHADADGFLWAGDQTTQLTWMDVKVGDVAVTPRHGRPVEIQALWYNALRVLEEFGRLLGDVSAATGYGKIADALHRNFEQVFWYAEGNYLYDVAGATEPDSSMRPNQIFAVSLHHPLLSKPRSRSVLDAVQRELLTPYGLRTLSPADHRYRGRYEGDVWSRDSAYHQGTVWPWLAGPFFSAQLQVTEAVDQTLDEIDAWLSGLENHLHEAGLGQVSEIFDGDSPHIPRGCIAQAWSVAEILRLSKLVLKHPGRRSG